MLTETIAVQNKEKKLWHEIEGECCKPRVISWGKHSVSDERDNIWFLQVSVQLYSALLPFSLSALQQFTLPMLMQGRSS